MSAVIKCKKVAVAILGFNSEKLLEKFIPSILNTDYDDFTLVYIDNASTDNSLKVVQDNFEEVLTIPLEKNYGFAGGYNEGLKHIESEFFVLINQDVEVTPGWLKPIISAMDIDEKLGAAQPKILHYNDKKKFDYAGASGGYIDKYGYPFCRGRIFDKIEEDFNQYDDEKEIFWASGACLVIRAKIYNEIKGLDSDFFAHMEEIDLCWRLQSLGYKVKVFPKAKVYHVGGSSLNYGSYRKIYLNYLNNIVMLFKNLHSSKLISILISRMILDGVSAVRSLFYLDFKTFGAIFMAHMSFYSSIPKNIKKRKKVVKNKSILTIYPESIVYQFFLKGNRDFSSIKW